jgi:hypothetical protein
MRRRNDVSSQKGIDMHTQLTSDKGQEHDPTQIEDPPNIQPADATLMTSFVPVSAPASHPPVQPSYYYQDEEEQEEQDQGMSSQFAVPFQLSTAMPVIETDHVTGPGQVIAPSTPMASKPSRSPALKIALVATVVVVALGFLWFTVFAQPAQPLATSNGATTPVAHSQAPAPAPTAAKLAGPTAKPTPVPTPINTGSHAQNGTWIPQQLPTGWVAAGLTNGDALFAERTAWAFTDREEGLDFRNMGTRTQHGGTFTASTFILSPGGKIRFAQNDIRVIDNTLFDHAQNVQLIQAAVNAIPSLTQFQVQGQNQFATVTVSYQLYQSQIDPATGQRTEGMEMDTATKQPRTHLMSVLLVRVPPGTQAQGAPMGGTGWLVSSYGLDLTSPLAIVQPV